MFRGSSGGDEGTVTTGMVKGDWAAVKQDVAPPHSVWPTIMTVDRSRESRKSYGWNDVDDGK